MIADSTGSVPPRGEGRWLFLSALAATLVAFSATLSIPFSYDDLDVLDVVTLWRNGAYRFIDLLFLPHNEHLIPTWRLAFSASIWEFGADARFLHLALLALHAVGAWAVGRLAGAAGAGRTGRFAAAISYAAAAGFAGTAVWYPTASVVMGAWVAVLVGLTCIFRAPAAAHSAASPPTRPAAPVRAALWSLAGLSATTGALPGLAAPWIALVLASFGKDRKEKARARGVAAALALLAVGLLILVRIAYSRYSREPFPSPSLQGLPTFLTILGSAPGHFLTAAVGAYRPDHSLLLAASAAGWLFAALAFWRAARNGRPSRDVLLSLWGGAAALAFAIGINRPDVTLVTLPSTNRYYYSFAAPLCLSLGLLVEAIPVRGRHRLRTIGVSLLLAAFLFGERRSLRPTMWSDPYEATVRFWGHAELLARLIAAEAGKPGAPPWAITDGQVYYQGIHDGSLALSTIVRTIFPRPIAGEHFVQKGAPNDDRRRQNEVLDRWADALGVTTAPICATPTGLGAPPAAISVADFRAGAREDVVVSGLYGWEPPFRWMGPMARLRLAIVPGDLLVRAWMPPKSDLIASEAEPFDLEARIGDTSLGTFRFDPAGGEQIARFPTAGRVVADGRMVVVELASPRVWRPSETIKGSRDTRKLTIGLFVVGFSDEAWDVPKWMRCLGGTPPPKADPP